MTTLFDTPPEWAHLYRDLDNRLCLLDNMRPDDPANARRAAARVKAGRKAACGTVYGYLHEQWPKSRHRDDDRLPVPRDHARPRTAAPRAARGHG